jgi:hypothetical protein
MPFRRTEEDPEERISLIQEIHLSEKPLSFMTCSVTSCQFYQNLFKIQFQHNNLSFGFVTNMLELKSPG